MLKFKCKPCSLKVKAKFINVTTAGNGGNLYGKIMCKLQTTQISGAC